MKAICFPIFAIVVLRLGQVQGHGMMLEPPNRSSMWRFGYPVPPNYNDMELFCGGRGVNGGRCGECGDNWALSRPRPNENGGRYGRGIVVRKYVPGQTIQTLIRLTANHNGYFEFRLCQLKHSQELETDSCFNLHLLTLENGSTRYYLPSPKPGEFPVTVRLPLITCERCVLQWHYVTANNWGICSDGSQGTHCGIQEIFRGCADISIG